MRITPDNKLQKLIIIGDRLLIRPSKPNERTDSGLYLPPGVGEREKVQQGYVIKTGPGYVVPMATEDEHWKSAEEQIKYIPLQAREGDREGLEHGAVLVRHVSDLVAPHRRVVDVSPQQTRHGRRG